MDSLEFSDNEIKSQLAALGYANVSEARMKQFKKDLHRLIEHDRSLSGSSSWFTGVSSPSSNSDFSESDRNKTSGSSMPYSSLNRFQPHLKVPSRPVRISDSTDTQEPSRISEISSQYPTVDKENYVPQPQIQQYRPKSVDTPETPSHFITDSSQHESDTESVDSSVQAKGKVIRKRKVLRKQSDGTPRIYDESLIKDQQGTYRMNNLSVDDSDPRLLHPTQKLQLPPRPHSARPMFKKDVNFEAFVSPDQPPSYIRPNTSHPHTRNIKKTDPVNRYHQYKDFWTNVKAPGEKSHKELRWEVKAQMMYKEEPAPKPQRVYVPNTYVVPTSKKRSALRWEVRHAMERGLPVPTAFDVY
uniref:Hydrolethalus syndrome protein 1 homolog n=1 Tax=Phallusia mammillata TaxID=59560 RepID=A0A6F9DFK0_9ASCI|nr:hydrolethalus syndrome protein 1 homolog [Phallusia mammillata]